MPGWQADCLPEARDSKPQQQDAFLERIEDSEAEEEAAAGIEASQPAIFTQ